jgi:hypothetical protein
VKWPGNEGALTHHSAIHNHRERTYQALSTKDPQSTESIPVCAFGVKASTTITELETMAPACQTPEASTKASWRNVTATEVSQPQKEYLDQRTAFHDILQKTAFLKRKIREKCVKKKKAQEAK